MQCLTAWNRTHGFAADLAQPAGHACRSCRSCPHVSQMGQESPGLQDHPVAVAVAEEGQIWCSCAHPWDEMDIVQSLVANELLHSTHEQRAKVGCETGCNVLTTAIKP